MKKLKGVISAAVLSLYLLTPAHAEEQRYISIRNTDTVWVPGNICVYRFRLDNGGSGEGFGPLALSLRLKDKQGNTLATEASEGYQTDLPLSVFDPQYYRPLPVSVAGGKAS